MEFEDVKVGDRLPPIQRIIRLANMVAYGAATWDFIRLHYDIEYAKAIGLNAPVVDGQMFGAYLSQLVLSWTGPRAFIRKLSFQNRGMVFPGDQISCYGVVKSTSEIRGDFLVECDLWIDNQKNERVVYPAQALVHLSCRKGPNA